jgi:sulfate transport system permease protein
MSRLAATEALPLRLGLIALAALLLGLLVAVPLLAVFAYAFAEGPGRWLQALSTPAALSAIRLTLLTAALVVPINSVGGVAAAWAIARFRFPGRRALLLLLDLPLGVSPVVAGLLFVLLLRRQGMLGGLLLAHGVRLLFAPPAIVIATLFVTLPLVAREVLAVLEEQGQAEEEAALTLGASGPAVLLRVTLPRIRWALLQGAVLCWARALGEFGAVSVVSGHVRGLTETLPLHAESLYQEYDLTAAFAAASLLALLALLALGLRKLGAARSATSPEESR